jgi:hypothetical protein
VVAVRAAHGLADDLVHQAQRLQAVRGDAQASAASCALSLVFQRMEAQPSGLITE